MARKRWHCLWLHGTCQFIAGVGGDGDLEGIVVVSKKVIRHIIKIVINCGKFNEGHK